MVPLAVVRNLAAMADTTTWPHPRRPAGPALTTLTISRLTAAISSNGTSTIRPSRPARPSTRVRPPAGAVVAAGPYSSRYLAHHGAGRQRLDGRHPLLPGKVGKDAEHRGELGLVGLEHVVDRIQRVLLAGGQGHGFLRVRRCP